ncbi:MAG: hypothetical protein Q8L27_04430 [archaeon]|nr:hypothetical protein [archaeon]
MTTKFLTGFERDTLQQAYECMQCLEPITNPVCHSCLSNQINKWLSFYPSVKKKMMPKLKDYTQEVNNNVISSINCISCGESNVALCPYCFIEGFFNVLRKNKVDKMIIMDFLSTFNFDLGHEEYAKNLMRGSFK